MYGAVAVRDTLFRHRSVHIGSGKKTVLRSNEKKVSQRPMTLWEAFPASLGQAFRHPFLNTHTTWESGNALIST